MERIDQVEHESSGHFVRMREFISDSFRTAQLELDKGLAAVRGEMTAGFNTLRQELAVVEGRLEGVEGRLERIEGKLDRLGTARPSRLRRSKRGR